MPAPTICGIDGIAIAFKKLVYPDSKFWQWQHTTPYLKLLKSYPYLYSTFYRNFTEKISPISDSFSVNSGNMR